MSHHLVLGAGGIGRATTLALVEAGHTVTLASRSGVVADRPWEMAHPDAVTVLAVDATDVARVTTLAQGCESIVNAINPPRYTTWDRDWPPVAAALLNAAERSGAGLVIIGNLYGYGVVDGPMREDSPLRPAGHKGRLRAQMWQDALARQREGRLRVTELRSSDYFGPSATPMTSYVNDGVVKRVLAGRRPVMPVGNADVPHSWTYIPDVGALAARLATDERSWGHVWHTPTDSPRTLAEVAEDAARLSGRPYRRVLVPPRAVVTALGFVVPFFRELRETRHQFERPFVLDSNVTEDTFEVQPTPWDVALKATVDALAG